MTNRQLRTAQPIARRHQRRPPNGQYHRRPHNPGPNPNAKKPS